VENPRPHHGRPRTSSDERMSQTSTPTTTEDEVAGVDIPVGNGDLS
jgi:hypothetical protein